MSNFNYSIISSTKLYTYICVIKLNPEGDEMNFQDNTIYDSDNGNRSCGSKYRDGRNKKKIRWGEKKRGRDTFVLLGLIEPRAISFESFESSKMARVTRPRKQRHRRSRETFRIREGHSSTIS